MTAQNILESALALSEIYRDDPAHIDLKLFLWELIGTFDATRMDDGHYVSDEPKARFTTHWNTATIPWK